MLVFLRFLCAFLFCSSLLNAQLVFKQEKLEFTAKASERELTARFTFENKGNSPVTIENVKSSCGCTVAEPDKKVYAPGESGSISATFTFGERSGAQSKTIKIHTDHPALNKHDLLLKVNILKSMTLKPNLLRWEMGGEPTTQRLTVQLLDPKTMKFAGPEANPEGFVIEEVANDLDGEIWLNVTPKSATEKTMQRVRLFVKTNDTMTESEMAYFLIR